MLFSLYLPPSHTFSIVPWPDSTDIRCEMSVCSDMLARSIPVNSTVCSTYTKVSSGKNDLLYNYSKSVNLPLYNISLDFVSRSNKIFSNRCTSKQNHSDANSPHCNINFFRRWHMPCYTQWSLFLPLGLPAVLSGGLYCHLHKPPQQPPPVCNVQHKNS